MVTASLVSCGKRKSDQREVSYKLYESSQFEKYWAAGASVGVPFVMSAEHGLVDSDTRLDPYEHSLYNESELWRQHWASEIVTDLDARFERVVLFGGRVYVDPIVDALDRYRPEVVVRDPFQYTSGNGQQQAIAGDIVEVRRRGGSVEEALDIATEPYRGDGS